MLSNVPVTGQTLDNSRPIINNNFVVIDNTFSINHVQYNDGSGNGGMHRFVQFPTQTPISSTGVSNVALYSKLGPISNVPELFFQRANLGANAGYSITECLAATNGWTTLPSGIIMQWGTMDASSGLPGNTWYQINFPRAFPNHCFSVQCSSLTGTSNPQPSTTDTSNFVVVSSDFNLTRFFAFNRIHSGLFQNSGFIWFAVGN